MKAPTPTYEEREAARLLGSGHDPIGTVRAIADVARAGRASEVWVGVVAMFLLVTIYVVADAIQVLRARITALEQPKPTAEPAK